MLKLVLMVVKSASLTDISVFLFSFVWFLFVILTEVSMIIILTLCIFGGNGSDDGIIVTVIFPHSVFVVVYYVFLYHLLQIYVLFFLRISALLIMYFCIKIWCLLCISVLSIMYFCIIYYVFLYYDLVMFKVVAVIITLGSFSD